MQKTIEPWREAWRWIAPKLPLNGLEALRTALLKNDPRIYRGDVCWPLGKYEGQVRAACPIGYTYWQALKDRHVFPDYLREKFDDLRNQNPLLVNTFVDWVDNYNLTPEDKRYVDNQSFRSALLPEVEREIVNRTPQEKESVDDNSKGVRDMDTNGTRVQTTIREIQTKSRRDRRKNIQNCRS